MDYSGVATALTVSLAPSSAQNTVGAGIDTVVAFENLVGGTGGDTLGGDENANVISGNAGTDTITGDGANDAINGDLGIDTIEPSSGGSVTVVLSPATGLHSRVQQTASGTDSLLGIENITGGSGADVLTGETGPNVLTGNGGNDILAGLDGNDTLGGGQGSDTLAYSAAAMASPSIR